jgi:uncharacterized protein YyaL (SSP411 family)
MDIYAIYTYGNTVVTANFAMLNVEYARVFGVENSADKIEVVKKILEAVDKNAWDEDFKGYLYKPGSKKDLLYPNIVMMLVYGRLYQLTKDTNYLERTKMLYEAIQVQKDKAMGCYNSPYSKDVMGAKTDDYKTLSSQNYTMLALLTLYENSHDKKYLDEVDGILSFVESHIYFDGMALHHWMDGAPAKPEHPEYYCTGCNLQLLYVIRHFWKFL